MTRSARITNEKVAEFIAKEVLKTAIQQKKNAGKVKVNILGFTYKENTPDIRNTQLARLATVPGTRATVMVIA